MCAFAPESRHRQRSYESTFELLPERRPLRAGRFVREESRKPTPICAVMTRRFPPACPPKKNPEGTAHITAEFD
jgi:hypothetical protein